MPNRPIKFLSQWWACYDQNPSAKIRLFCFPHGGSGANVFQQLSNKLTIAPGYDPLRQRSPDSKKTVEPALTELYALCLPGRGARRNEAPYIDIRLLAIDVVESMRPYLNEKPFALLGHSVGALLAFEVARILEKEKGCPAMHVFLSSHCAPEDINTSMYRWSDAELCSVLMPFGVIDSDNEMQLELLKLNLPIIRADFEWAETYNQRAHKLTTTTNNAFVLTKTPMTLLGGDTDKLCHRQQLEKWADHCTGNFSLEIFSGSHFYWQDQLQILTALIDKHLRVSLANLERSALLGPLRPDYPLHLCPHEVFEATLVKMVSQNQSEFSMTNHAICQNDPRRRIAVVDPHLGCEITYWQLNVAAERLAEFLQLLPDFKRNSFIAIYMEHSVAYVILMLGISKAGGCYLPIETHSTPEMVNKTVQKCQPIMLFTSKQFIETLPQSVSPDSKLPFSLIDLAGTLITHLENSITTGKADESNPVHRKTVHLLKPTDCFTERGKTPCTEQAYSVQDWVTERINRRPDCRPDPENLEFVCMTSGTTGEPKAILDIHRAVINSFFYRYEQFPYKIYEGEPEREAVKVFFIWEVLRPLLQGHTAYIIPDEVIYAPNELIDFLAAHAINRVLLTPSLCNEVLNSVDIQTAEVSTQQNTHNAPATSLAQRLPYLTHIVLNGEVLLIETINQLKTRLPHTILINDYSIAETWDVCTHDLTSTKANNAFLSHTFAPAGRPQANQRVYIVDIPDDGQASDQKRWSLCPQGQMGEVFVAGPTLMREYFNDASQTRERLVRDVFFDTLTHQGNSTSDQLNGGSNDKTGEPAALMMFRTGDIGRMLANGHLEICGRTQYMVKLRGYTVVLSAIESALCNFPYVNSACVIAIHSPITRQPDHLVAYYTINTCAGSDFNEAELRHFLKTKLPHYCIPAFFMQLKALPINKISGKLDKKQLPAFDNYPTSSSSNAIKTLDTSSSVSILESNQERVFQLLANLLKAAFEEILKTDIPNPSISFFDLGGQSLLAIRLCTLLNKRLGTVLRKRHLDISKKPDALANNQKTASKAVHFIRVTQIFEHSSVDEIAHFLSHKISEGEFSWIVPTTQNQNPRKIPEITAVKSRTKHVQDIRYLRSKRSAVEPPTIAIVGTACRFPGEANCIEEYFTNLIQGRNCFRSISDAELLAKGVSKAQFEDKDYRKTGAFVEGVEDFDFQFFNMSAREALYLDPQHRLFLECCWEAVEDAGYVASELDKETSSTGVFGSVFFPSYLMNNLQGGGLLHGDNINPQLAHITETGNDKDYVPSRVAYLMDLRGPAVAIQTSCSSGLSVIASACNAIRNGDCDRALAGASSLTFPQAGYLFSEGAFFSKSGLLKPFDASADGTIFGDGCGVVFLKKLEDAQRDKDDILALIRSQGWNNDGKRKLGYSEPSSRGQSDAIVKCLAPILNHSDASVHNRLGYVECHGTGTLVGDPIEVEAIVSAFQQIDNTIDNSKHNRNQNTHDNAVTYLGSVKANIGHSNIASGMAGLLKTAMVVHSGKIPPTINFKTHNETLIQVLRENSRFKIATAKASKPTQGKNHNEAAQDKSIAFPHCTNDTPRLALTSSLGIGGTNCYLLLQQYKPQHDSLSSPSVTDDIQNKKDSGLLQDTCLLLISAKSQLSLQGMLSGLIARIQKTAEPNWETLEKTLLFGREHFIERRIPISVSFKGLKSMEKKRSSVLKTLEKTLLSVNTYRESENHPPNKKTDAEINSSDTPWVLLFPGQGAQHDDMAVDLYQSLPLFKQSIDDCCTVLREAVVPRAQKYTETIGLNALMLSDIVWPMLTNFASALFDQRPADNIVKSSIYIQLSLFTVEYALAQCYLSLIDDDKTQSTTKYIRKQKRQYHCIGHSIGEYVALCIAGRLSVEDAIFLVVIRSLLMMRADNSLDVQTEVMETPTSELAMGMLAVQGASEHFMTPLLHNVWKKMLAEMHHLARQGTAFTTALLFSSNNRYNMEKKPIDTGDHDSAWSFCDKPIVAHDVAAMDSLLEKIQHFVKASVSGMMHAGEMDNSRTQDPEMYNPSTPDCSLVIDQKMIAIAAVNSGVDIVLSGLKKELTLCAEFLETLFQFKSVEVKTPMANHHAYFLKDQAEQLTNICQLENISIGPAINSHSKFTVFSNLTGKAHDSLTAETGRYEYFAKHMTSPVRFDSNLRCSQGLMLQQRGHSLAKNYLLLEIGPGKILSSLSKKVLLTSANVQANSDPAIQPVILNAMRHPNDTSNTDITCFLASLGQIWQKKWATVNWSLLYAKDQFIKQRGICPTYSWDKTRCFAEPAALSQPFRNTSPPSPPKNKTDEQRLLDLDSRYFVPTWRLAGQTDDACSPAQFQHERLLHIDGGQYTHSANDNTAAEKKCARLNTALSEYIEMLGVEVSTLNLTSENSFKKLETSLDQLFDSTYDKNATQQNTDETCSNVTLLYTDLDCSENAEDSEAIAASAEAKWQNFFRLCQLLCQNEKYTHSPNLRVIILTTKMFRVGMSLDQKPALPSKAVLYGPVTVLPQENLNCHLRLIDLGESLDDGILPPSSNHLFQVFAGLSQELFCKTSSEKIIALRMGGRPSGGMQRFVPHYKPIFLTETHEKRGKDQLTGNVFGCPEIDSHMLNPAHKIERVFLITGGLGRIGLSICTALADLSQQNPCSKIRIILTTRGTFPPKPEWYKIIDEKHSSQDKVAGKKPKAVSKAVKECIHRLVKLERNSGDSLEILVRTLDFSCYENTQMIVHEAFARDSTGGAIFHCAGLAQLAYFQDIKKDIWQGEFEPKLKGTVFLSKALKILFQQRIANRSTTSLPPSSSICMVNFSSMASILGGYGMAAYCSANRFQDHFSDFLNASISESDSNHYHMLNINWDDWDFEYDDEQISAAAYARVRHFSMSPEAGIKSLFRVIGHRNNRDSHSGIHSLEENFTQILVATRKVEPRINKWLKGKGINVNTTAIDREKENSANDQNNNTEKMNHSLIINNTMSESMTSEKEALEICVLDIYARVLGSDEINLDANLFELGGDSLSASEILVALHKSSKNLKEIKIKDVLAHASPRELIQFISTRH